MNILVFLQKITSGICFRSHLAYTIFPGDLDYVLSAVIGLAGLVFEKCF